MTLLDLLTPLCFIAPAMAGIVGGKDAGGVGVMVGIGVGLVAGGLAYYALKKTYSDEFEEKLKSQPQFVQALIEKGTGAWIVFLLVAPALVTGFSINRWPANKSPHLPPVLDQSERPLMAERRQLSACQVVR